MANGKPNRGVAAWTEESANLDLHATEDARGCHRGKGERGHRQQLCGALEVGVDASEVGDDAYEESGGRLGEDNVCLGADAWEKEVGKKGNNGKRGCTGEGIAGSIIGRKDVAREVVGAKSNMTTDSEGTAKRQKTGQGKQVQAHRVGEISGFGKAGVRGMRRTVEDCKDCKCGGEGEKAKSVGGWKSGHWGKGNGRGRREYGAIEGGGQGVGCDISPGTRRGVEGGGKERKEGEGKKEEEEERRIRKEGERRRKKKEIERSKVFNSVLRPA